MIKEFIEILDRAKELHEKKNKDYANQSNQFENFERSAELMSWFNDPVDKSFVNLIGTKLARIATLRNSGGTAQNEPLEDSFFDLTVYCGLWAAYYKRQQILPVIEDEQYAELLEKHRQELAAAIEYNLKKNEIVSAYKCEWCGCEFSYTPTIHNNHFFCSDQCGGHFVNAKIKS